MEVQAPIPPAIRLLEAAAGKRLVVFDLDNTLMDETQYLFAGYDTVAAVAAGGDAPRAAAMGQWLRRAFLKEGRGQLFERLLREFPNAVGGMSDWLAALHSAPVPGGLTCFDWVAPFCDGLSGRHLAILTNGNAGQQRNKFQQLAPAALRDRFTLCCAADHAPKPDPAGLFHLMGRFHCGAQETLFIGDTATDEACAAAAGVSFAWAPPL